MIRALLIKWVILAIAIWVTAATLSGIEVDGGIGTYLLVALVFATVNVILGTIIRLLTLPLMVLTLGLFSLVVTAFMLLLTDSLMDSFHVDGLGSALAGALIIAIVTIILELVVRPSKRAESRDRA